MILTKFDTFTGKSEIAAKGTAKDIADYVTKLSESREYTSPTSINESDGDHIKAMCYDTLVAGILANKIDSFRIDCKSTLGPVFYSILDPEAPVKPLFTQEETIKSLKGDMYDTYATKMQERFASLMQDAECLGLELAYFSTEWDGVHLVAIPTGIKLTETKPENIPSIETINLVKDLPYIDRDKVITLYMGEGGSDRFCHRK